jgi:protease YdgD
MGMHGRFLAGVLFVTCLLAIGQAAARDLQPGIFGKDDRRAIGERSGAWAAIGQVNVSGYRYARRCTGTLIADNLVITAAHCVMDPWRRQPFPRHQIHFLAGVRGSAWLGHSTAKCLTFTPEYEYVGPRKVLPSLPFQRVPRRAFTQDMVLITLKDQLKDIAPVKLDRAKAQASDISLVHASYAADRRYVLTGHFGCHLLAREDNLWLTDCDTHAASSGGPVFIQTKNDLRLAAIMVGIVKESASIAVPTRDLIEFAAEEPCS